MSYLTPTRRAQKSGDSPQQHFDPPQNDDLDNAIRNECQKAVLLLELNKILHHQAHGLINTSRSIRDESKSLRRARLWKMARINAKRGPGQSG